MRSVSCVVALVATAFDKSREQTALNNPVPTSQLHACTVFVHIGRKVSISGACLLPCTRVRTIAEPRGIAHYKSCHHVRACGGDHSLCHFNLSAALRALDRFSAGVEGYGTAQVGQHNGHTVHSQRVTPLT